MDFSMFLKKVLLQINDAIIIDFNFNVYITAVIIC